MLKEMVNKNILPETLDQCSFLIRKLGNSGAHGDDIDMSQSDVLELIDFIETILYYIYELPVKIANVNDKYNLKLKSEGKEVRAENYQQVYIGRIQPEETPADIKTRLQKQRPKNFS